MNQFFLFYQIYDLLFQKNPPSQNDLNFLLGFFEGDGGCCQQKKESKNTTDFSYRITQSTVHILKIVKFLLDIGGNIYPKPKGNTAKTDLKPSSYRLVYGRREQLLCILALLHGNCRFPDRHQIFSK